MNKNWFALISLQTVNQVLYKQKKSEVISNSRLLNFNSLFQQNDSNI